VIETTGTAPTEDLDSRWQRVVERCSFLKGIGMAGAALSAGTLLASEGRAQSSSSERELSKGDVALLQFALWAELVESDLWTQYAELGGRTFGRWGRASERRIPGIHRRKSGLRSPPAPLAGAVTS
jgi:hypothetical protein